MGDREVIKEYLNTYFPEYKVLYTNPDMITKLHTGVCMFSKHEFEMSLFKDVLDECIKEAKC